MQYCFAFTVHKKFSKRKTNEPNRKYKVEFLAGKSLIIFDGSMQSLANPPTQLYFFSAPHHIRNDKNCGLYLALLCMVDEREASDRKCHTQLEKMIAKVIFKRCTWNAYNRKESFFNTSQTML